jgi:hypothetical protein
MWHILESTYQKYMKDSTNQSFKLRLHGKFFSETACIINARLDILCHFAMVKQFCVFFGGDR